MRDAVTSAMEVVGMMTFAVAAGALAGLVWIGVAAAGAVLAVAGALEARKS